MLTDDYLTLRSVRLVGTEKWEPGGSGCCFVFIRSGAGTFAISSASLRLTQGDILVFSVGISGNIRTTGNSRLIFSSFSVQVESLLPLFPAGEISRLQNLLGTFKSLKFYAADSPMATDCHRVVDDTPPGFSLAHRVHLLRIVAMILGDEFKSLQRERLNFDAMEEQLLQGLEKFSANDILSLSIDELAAKYGYSRRHLGRLFHKHFGFSVATLRMELRMLRAISLLRDGHVKLKQVAEQCGFSRYAVFNKFFKRRFGTSPGQWRALGFSRSPASAIPPPIANHSDCLLQSNGMCPILRVPNPARTFGATTVRLKNSTVGTAPDRTRGVKAVMARPDLQPIPLAGSHKPAGSPKLNAFI